MPPRPRRLLIVDDDEDIQRSYRRVAEANGYHVLQCFDGAGVLELVRAERPDVIVLDINMPKADGRDVLQELQAAPDTAKIPVLICSARVDQFSRHLGLELGAVDYIEKPCTAEDLVRRIRHVIDRE